MASTNKDTGHGASLAFSAGLAAFAVPIRKIGAVEQEVPKVDTTDLSLTECTSNMPGDLLDPGTFEVEYCYDATVGIPVMLTTGTVTITAPLATGQATAANLAGKGFVKKATATPEFATNGLQIGKMTVRFDGKTGPTLTVAVDT